MTLEEVFQSNGTIFDGLFRDVIAVLIEPHNLLSRKCAKVRTFFFLPRTPLEALFVSERRYFPTIASVSLTLNDVPTIAG